MRIVVAGGGIGGLTAALALARAGYEVTLAEQADALREVGAGLQLSPNAMKVLRALGVEQAIAAIASRPDALELRLGRSGRKVFSIPLGEKAEKRYGAPYLHVHRADLVEVLRAAVEAAGVRIRLGNRVAAFVRDGNLVRAGLDTGEIVETDVLIGADGMHSAVQAQMLGPDHPRYTGAVAWRTIAPASVAPHLPNAAVVWTGPGRHAVTYRVRRGELINFVGVIEEGDWRGESWNEAGDRAELLVEFGGFSDDIVQVIGGAGICHRWALYDRDPLPRWTKGRVALLGDACHPMPPFQAQGAAMAMEDAFVLARCLHQDPRSPESALREYERLRKPRTTKVLASARGNMGVFHRSNALTQAATYGPMMAANAVLPFFIRSRQDWIYGFDVTKG
jgi:salicylate hydroxylase